MNLPVFETERLILREVKEKDIHDMYEYASISFIGPNAGWEPHTSLSYTKEVIKMYNSKPRYGQLGVFAIVLKENKKMIGTIELHTYTPNFKAELGYTVNPEYWNNGFATEASKAVISWGFTSLNLKRIECSFFPNNIRSMRVCEHLLFKYECVKRNGYMLYNNEIKDLVCYAMTDSDYTNIVNNKLWEK